MSFADMRTMTNLIKFLSIKRDSPGITISLDGRCVFAECKIEVVEEKEIVNEKGKSKKVPSLVKLSSVNAELSFKYNQRVDMRRCLIELSREIYELGEMLPFQRIVEPTTDQKLPYVLIRVGDGYKAPSVEILKKAMRLYMAE
jgi:hypothetical protein